MGGGQGVLTASFSLGVNGAVVALPVGLLCTTSSHGKPKAQIIIFIFSPHLLDVMTRALFDSSVTPVAVPVVGKVT